ncbi:hypothetical protein HYT84_02285 [Candidatus Micrarchaeota archaeon]|nr:hypothetical protein [Candidatus Micrarchaeota archaeon]
MQMVCAKIEAAVTTLLSHAPEPVTASPPLSTDGLVARFAAAGFIDIQTGAFLVGAGREALINEVVNIRPIHQGRLNGVADSDRERIITQAIAEAHSECDAIVISGEPDPRKVETNLWDAVPFLKAVKSAVAPRTKKLSGPDMDELAEAPWFVGGGTSHGNKGDRPILDGFDRGD